MSSTFPVHENDPLCSDIITRSISSVCEEILPFVDTLMPLHQEPRSSANEFNLKRDDKRQKHKTRDLEQNTIRT